jgi:hypothetical protein
MEYAEEEEVNSQRFDITIVWPADSDNQITDNEIRGAIEQLVRDVDENGVVEVEEVVEPAY